MIVQDINSKNINVFYEENQAEITTCYLEDTEQINFTNHLRHNHPELVYFHPINEGLVPVHYRAKQRQKGMLAGASDIIILNANRHFNFLTIELKRESKKLSSTISTAQIEFLKNCEQANGFACVAYGYKAALFVVEQYIKDNLTFVRDKASITLC